MTGIELPGITLGMLINADILAPGTSLFSIDKQKAAILNADGSLTVNIDNSQHLYYSPSGAALAVMKRSLNGWIFWGTYESGIFRDLKFYRDLYSN